MDKLYQIKFINKADRYNPFERILSVGGWTPNGSRWLITQEEAIDAMENGQLGFFIETEGQPVPVVVAVSETGHRYLKTKVDGVQPSRLLDLPESW